MEQASSAAEPESPCEPAASTPAEIGHASPTGTACPRPGLLIPITHPEVGRTLAAAVPIAKGDLVIRERPLLAVPALRALPREMRRLLRGGARELRVPIANFLNVYAYTKADPDVRRKVLTFCSYEVHTAALPDNPPADNDTPPLPRIINMAMRVSAWWTAQPELVLPQVGDIRPEGVACAAILPIHTIDDGALFSVEELTRAQCCFSLNGHDILENDSGAGTGARARAASVVLYPEPEPQARSTSGDASCEATSDSAKPAATQAAAGATHALFLQGSRLTHVCGHPNTVYHYQNGYGCHRALRDISAGEMITSCYIGARAACGRRIRRSHLRENYLFDCGCTACSEGKDDYRELPCPHCGIERDSRTGLLLYNNSEDLLECKDLTEAAQASPSKTSVKYGGGIRRDVLSLEASECEPASSTGPTDDFSDLCSGAGSTTGSSACWQCCSCDCSFTDDEVDCPMIGPAPSPLQLNSPATLFDWERRIAEIRVVASASLADAVYNLVEASDAGKLWDQSPSDLVDTRRSLTRAVRAVLGGEHWATATCEELLLEALLDHAIDIYGPDTEDDHIGQAAEKAADNVACAEIWNLVTRLWYWFEVRGFHAVWSIPEDLLEVMRKWPALADYIEADEQRSRALREITEATLDRTIVEFGIGSTAHIEILTLLGKHSQ